jgi:hypothetical protein
MARPPPQPQQQQQQRWAGEWVGGGWRHPLASRVQAIHHQGGHVAVHPALSRHVLRYGLRQPQPRPALGVRSCAEAAADARALGVWVAGRHGGWYCIVVGGCACLDGRPLPLNLSFVAAALLDVVRVHASGERDLRVGRGAWWQPAAAGKLWVLHNSSTHKNGRLPSPAWSPPPPSPTSTHLPVQLSPCRLMQLRIAHYVSHGEAGGGHRGAGLVHEGLQDGLVQRVGGGGGRIIAAAPAAAGDGYGGAGRPRRGRARRVRGGGQARLLRARRAARIGAHAASAGKSVVGPHLCAETHAPELARQRINAVAVRGSRVFTLHSSPLSTETDPLVASRQQQPFDGTSRDNHQMRVGIAAQGLAPLGRAPSFAALDPQAGTARNQAPPRRPGLSVESVRDGVTVA